MRVCGWGLRCLGWLCAIAAVLRLAEAKILDAAMLLVAGVTAFAVGEVLHYLVRGHWHSLLLDTAIGGRANRVEVHDPADYFGLGDGVDDVDDDGETWAEPSAQDDRSAAGDLAVMLPVAGGGAGGARVRCNRRHEDRARTWPPA